MEYAFQILADGVVLRNDDGYTYYYNFGVIDEGANPSKTFEIKNIGDTNVVIRTIALSSHRYSPQNAVGYNHFVITVPWGQEPWHDSSPTIAPGASISFEIECNSASRNHFYYWQTISIYADHGVDYGTGNEVVLRYLDVKCRLERLSLRVYFYLFLDIFRSYFRRRRIRREMSR